MDGGFIISPSHGVQLMALAQALSHGDLVLAYGVDPEECLADAAEELLRDVAQEIAMQVGA